jgi:hypothetical protein
VPETITLPKLHSILQWTMGWTNSHLHEYEIGQHRYGMLDDEGFDHNPPLDERRVRFKPLLDAGVRRLTYLHDFGAGWDHDVIIEDLMLPKLGIPPVVCTAGENACPPEDVGGPPGYFEFLTAISSPLHEEHARMLEWVGGSFDPKAFSLEDINEWLSSIKA